MLDRGREVMCAPETVEVAEGIDTFGFVVAAIELGGGFVFGRQETKLNTVLGLQHNKLNVVAFRHGMQGRANLHLEGALVAEADIRQVFLTHTGFFVEFGLEEFHFLAAARRNNA